MKPKFTCLIALVMAAGMSGVTMGQERAAGRKTLGLEEGQPVAALVKSVEAVDPRQKLGLERFMGSLNQHLATTFGNVRMFQTVVRADLAKVIAEQQLPVGLIRDPADVKGLPGRIKGLDFLVVPNVTDFSDVQRGQVAGGMDMVVSARTVKAAGVFKIYDCTTGAQLTSVSIPVTIDRRGIDRQPPAGGAFGNRAADDSQIDQAAMEMADRAALEVTNRVFPIFVIGTFDDQVTISRGEDGRVAVGQVWDIYALGDDMIDPATGQSMGKMEVKIGEIEITTVDGNKASGRVLGNNRGIAKGAKAKLKQMPMRPVGPDRGERLPLPR